MWTQVLARSLKLYVCFVFVQSNLQDEWKWQKLEEIVTQVASKKPIMIFKPSRALFTSEMPTTECPIGVHGGMFPHIIMRSFCPHEIPIH